MDKTQNDARHEKLALFAAVAALLIGWMGSALFYDLLFDSNPVIGVGFPLFVLALLIGGLTVAKVSGVELRPRVLWLIVPIGFFAGMVAIRAEITLTVLNIGMTLVLGALLVHYLPLDKSPDEDTTMTHIGATIFVGMYAALGTLSEIIWVRRALRHLHLRGSERTMAVLRGIMFAVPVVIVFGVLLASADTVFSDVLSGLFGGMTDLSDLVARVIVALAFAWGVLGLITYASRVPFGPPRAREVPLLPTDDAMARDTSETAAARVIVDEAEAREKAKRLPGMGMIETSIVLGSVIALFGVFVLIQFAYLFGGQANIREGVTYAQYARRGFFELVAVAVLVIGLGRYLHMQTRRYSQRATLLFRLECVAIVGLTLVVLASAWHRMALYEEAYGFTQLRLYTYVFMGALAALLGFFLLEVFTRRKTIFAFGILLVAIGYVAVLNGIGGEGFIASRNIQRFQQGKELDLCYLKTFSVDALPQMLTLLDIAEAREDEPLIQHVRMWLAGRDAEVSRWSSALPTLNIARMDAKILLDAVPREKRAEWARTFYSYCGNGYRVR